MSTTSQYTTFIYGLVDPTTQQLRYVGKSNDPKVRSYQHVCASQLVRGCHKNHWVKKLLADGQKPEMFVIEEVPSGKWAEAEQFWIAYFKSIGTNLTNSTQGGDGATGLSAETRKKIGDSCRGKARVFSQDHKEKIASANRARACDPLWRKKMSDAMTGNTNGLGVPKSASHKAALSAHRKAEFSAKTPEERTAFAMRGVAARLAKAPRSLLCVVCGGEFNAWDMKAKHCSGKCKQAWHRARKDVYVIV